MFVDGPIFVHVGPEFNETLFMPYRTTLRIAYVQTNNSTLYGTYCISNGVAIKRS